MSKNDSLALIRSIKPITFSYSKQNRDYEKYFSSSSLKGLLKTGVKKLKVDKKYQLPVLKEQKKVNDDDIVNIKIQSSFKYVTDLSSLKDFQVSSLKKKKITQEYLDKMKLYKELFCITKEKFVDMEFRKKRYERIKDKYIELKSYGVKEVTLDPGKYYPKYDILYKRYPVTVFGTAGLKNKNDTFLIKSNDYNYNDDNLKKLNKNNSADNLNVKKRYKIKSEQTKKRDGYKHDRNIKKTDNTNNINVIPLSQTVRNTNKYTAIDGFLKIEQVNSFEFPKKLSTSLNFYKQTTRRGLLKKSTSLTNVNKIKCPVVFNKMPGRDRKVVEESGLDDVNYTPNYDIIRPHVPATIFKHSFDFSKFKKYITGKIIRNYCFTPDQYFVLEINKNMEKNNKNLKHKKGKNNNKNRNKSNDNNINYVYI